MATHFKLKSSKPLSLYNLISSVALSWKKLPIVTVIEVSFQIFFVVNLKNLSKDSMEATLRAFRDKPYLSKQIQVQMHIKITKPSKPHQFSIYYLHLYLH